MRILLAGATGGVGRAMARQLLAAGHTVTGIAQRPHANLDPEVDLVCGPLTDAILQHLADDADVVIHLAPIEAAAPDSAGINGLVHIAHAASRAGARLIYLSHAAGPPKLYRHAETLVSSGWAPSLIVRAAPPIGRQLDWTICRTVGSLLHAKESTAPLRLLHFDDLLRFLMLAVATNRTGVVDLATPDTLELRTASRLLRAVQQQPRLARLPSWADLMPDLDVTAVQQDWQFEFGWHARDAIADTVRGLSGRKLNTRGVADLAGHLPLPLEVITRTEPSDGAALLPAGPEGLTGEFDDRIDARFPVFSVAALAERLPGPLTPMTLDVQLTGLRGATRMMSQLMACGDVVAGEWGSRAIAVFGHRPYVGVSASVIAAEQLPGWDVDEVVRQSLGGAQVGELLPLGRPTGRLLGPAAKAVVVRRALALLRHLKSDTEAYVSAATSEHLDAVQLNSRTEGELATRTRLLRDRIHQGWSLTALWLIDSGITAATVERTGLHVPVSGVAALLESDAVAAKTSSLAALLRGDPQLCTLALDRDLDGITAFSRTIGAAFTAAVQRIGHRGPGEVELANLMIGDDPSTLLAAAAHAATAVPQETPADFPQAKISERMAASARASRELAYDATIRFTHELRMTLRELGSRLEGAEVLDFGGEIFYLTCDEAVTPPADARLRIKRRRAERERLQGRSLPDVITVS